MFKSFISVMLTTSALLGCQIGSGPATTPITSPTPIPTTMPTSIPIPPNETTAPSSTPTPVPTLGPILPPTGTSFSGSVFNEAGLPLERVIVTARTIRSDFPYEDTAETNHHGEYLFRNGPLSNEDYLIEIQLTASKPGYINEEQTIILKQDEQNQFNFMLQSL